MRVAGLAPVDAGVVLLARVGHAQKEERAAGQQNAVAGLGVAAAGRIGVAAAAAAAADAGHAANDQLAVVVPVGRRASFFFVFGSVISLSTKASGVMRLLSLNSRSFRCNGT